MIVMMNGSYFKVSVRMVNTIINDAYFMTSVIILMTIINHNDSNDDKDDEWFVFYGFRQDDKYYK